MDPRVLPARRSSSSRTSTRAMAQLLSICIELLPRGSLKKPFSPQNVPQLLRMCQYFSPVRGSAPHPTTSTSWSTSVELSGS